jgi:Zn-dependent protease
LLALFAHESAHYFMAVGVGGASAPLTLQVTGGGSYVRSIDSKAKTIMVLAAGPVASALLAVLALNLRLFVFEETPLFSGFFGALFYASAIWTIYQLTPFPPLDAGQILRVALAPKYMGATAAWRVGWALGFVAAGAWVLFDVKNAEPAVLLTGMALILGRAEAGYVRHLDAYAAWEKRDYKRVIELVQRVPDYLDKSDRWSLLELGMFAAMESEDAASLETIAQKLPPHRPVVMKAAEWLLVRGKAFGAKIAQHALDALDHEVVKPNPEEKERFADVAFRFAVYEVKEGRVESALGLLERAVGLGFKDVDRIKADSDLARLETHPRFSAILAKIEV